MIIYVRNEKSNFQEINEALMKCNMRLQSYIIAIISIYLHYTDKIFRLSIKKITQKQETCPIKAKMYTIQNVDKELGQISV